MKVSKEIIVDKEFQPVKIVINIESIEELKALWLRFNLAPGKVLDKTTNNIGVSSVNDFASTHSIWESLNEELIKYVQY